MNRLFLGCLLVLVPVVAPPLEARASACASDRVELEPKDTVVSFSPEAFCLAVVARSSGCGEQIELELTNNCNEAVVVSGPLEGCSDGSTCEIAPGEHESFVIEGTLGDEVELTLTATIEGVDTDVSVSFSVEEQEVHEGGCSASPTRAAASGALPLLAAALLALSRRRRS